MEFTIDCVTSTLIKDEWDRIKRIEEQTKSYNQLLASSEIKESRLVLDFDPNNGAARVEVDPVLVKELKEHQREGIQFLYDSTIENMERIQEPGSGCILNHHAGLGKTLQVVAFAHAVLSSHAKIFINTILIVVPDDLTDHWITEFDKWITKRNLKLPKIYQVDTVHSMEMMLKTLREWKETGGVLIMEHDIFEEASLGLGTGELDMYRLLTNPGPDMVIVDDGPGLEVPLANLHRAISIIRTRRKIILTNEPILDSAVFYSVISLVRPEILISKEDLDRDQQQMAESGQRPGNRGVTMVSWQRVHESLSGCVQQFGGETLNRLLKPKFEYVLFVRPTKVMSRMYNYYLDHAKPKVNRILNSLLFTVNHPAIHQQFKASRLNQVDSDSQSGPVSASDYFEWVPFGEIDEDELDENRIGLDKDWFQLFVTPNDWKRTELSTKFVLLFKILRECIQVGDKLIVVSQSLETLNLIEKCLERFNNIQVNGENVELRWKENVNYFRLDRKEKIECPINDPDNKDAHLCMLHTPMFNVGSHLTGVNRCIFFDVNSDSDEEKRIIDRIYRMGQTKSVYIYRFVTKDTFEDTFVRWKLGRIGISRHPIISKNKQVDELYKVRPKENYIIPFVDFPSDHLLTNILTDGNQEILRYINLNREEEPEDKLPGNVMPCPPQRIELPKTHPDP